MDRKHQLKFCQVCKNRKFDLKRGIVCSLSDDYAKFEVDCDDYVVDIEAEEKQIEKDELRRKEKEKEMTGGLSSIGIKNGVVAGIVITAFGLFWVIINMSAGPNPGLFPLLIFIFGLVVLVKGIKFARSGETLESKKKSNDQLIDN